MRNKVSVHHLSGIFIISFATLLLELSLTRVLSVSLWYHFGFLIISTALLGFGAAGVTLSVSKRLRQDSPLDKTLALLSIAFGFSTVLSFWLMQRIPFDPFSLLSDKTQLFYMPLYYFAVLLPFYFSGLVIGLLLTRSGSSVNRLYAADLVGAGLGCAAIAVVMPQFGGSGSVLMSAAFGTLAATAFTWHEARNWRLIGLTSFAVLTFLSFFAATLLPIKTTVNKGAALKDFTPVYSEWNTFSKIDLYDFPADTVRKFPRVLRFVIDGGTAATGIVELSKGIDNVLDDVRRDPKKRYDLVNVRAEVAALSKKNPKVLIIGSGAGDEIFESLVIGASSITAVELNPIIVKVQRDIMKDQWGRMNDRPEVKLVVDEGRNFIKRSNEKYDIILSSHTISNAAVASGALSLAENYVLTREAFEDYLDHLTEDGVLYFTRPEIQLARLFTTATEMFLDRGVQFPGDHIFAYTEPSWREIKEKYKFTAGFVMKKSPFLEPEVNAIESLLEIHTDTSAIARQILYSPFGPNHESIYHNIVNSKDLKALYTSSTIQLAPATDDKPFFNQHVPWSSISWEHFREIFTQNNRGRLALEDKPVAEITLVTILFQSLLIAAILILLPLWKFSRQGLQTKGKWNFLVYFAGLGLGFILIEIALLQRFNLYLGQPVYTYAVILASLLIFTGIGSYLSERFDQGARAIFTKLVPLILLVLMGTALLIPFISNATLHFPLALRVFISIILVAPLGIVLGMPFPLGLRLIGKEAGPLAPWAWGVNGFFTVIGSVTAVILGMAFGFTVVLATAAACYSLAGVVIAFRPSASPLSEEHKTAIDLRG